MSLDLPHKERDINGTMYRAHTLMLDQWAECTEFLAGVLGEPLASLLRGDTVLAGELGPGDFQSIVAGLAGQLTKKRIMELAVHLSRSLRHDGHVMSVDSQKLWWPAHMKDLAPAVALFLEAQYSDFYEGLSDSLPATRSAVADLSAMESGE